MNSKSGLLLQLAIALPLILLVMWGRSASEVDTQHHALAPAVEWSMQQSLMHKAVAGAMPGFAADISVLTVFDIFALSQQLSDNERQPLWHQMYYEIEVAQSLDPWFRDTYRLAEGLLAYEAGKMAEAVDILRQSESYLNSSDPLLVASFLAHRELHDDNLAIELATLAATKPDATPFAIGFAARLIHKQNGCDTAVMFLKSRLLAFPEEYRNSIEAKIQKIQQSPECTESFMPSHRL